MIAYPIQAGNHAQLIGSRRYAANPDPSVTPSELARYAADLTILSSKHSAGIAARTWRFVGKGGAVPDSNELYSRGTAVDSATTDKYIPVDW